MAKIYTCDLESNGLLDGADRIWCLVAKDFSNGDVFKFRPNEIEDGLQFVSEAKMLSFHSGTGYDYPLIKKLFEKHHAKLPKLADTLVMSRLIYPDIQDRGMNPKNMPPKLLDRHSIEAWGWRLGRGKPEHEDWSQFSEEMLHRCAEDVEIADLLLNKLVKENYSKEAIQLEHDFAHLMHLQEQSGFVFDVEKGLVLKEELTTRKDALIKILRKGIPDKIVVGKSPNMYHFEVAEEGWSMSAPSKGKLKALVKQFNPDMTLKAIDDSIVAGQPKITYFPFNPGSGKQRADFLKQTYGWEPTDFTEGGAPKTSAEVLEQLDYPLAKPLMEYMKVDKISGMLIGSSRGGVPWLDMIKGDGKIHGYINPCGTVTGRAKMSRPNMGQIPSVSMTQKGDLVYGLDGGYGADCRELFIPPKGMSQVGCDASGQELRNLAHYLYPHDKGAYVSEILDGDIHVKNQTVAELETRDEAKTFIYSYLYGCGPLITGFAVSADDINRFAGTEYEDKAHAYLDKNPIIIEGKRMVKKKKGHLVLLTDEIYLRAAKGIAVQEKFSKNLQGYSALQKQVTACVKAGRLDGLDGRTYHVRSAHKGLNVLLQGAGAVQMKKATKFHYDRMLAEGMVYDKDWMFMANIYDETQQAVIPDRAEYAGESMKLAFEEAGRFFNMNCPMTGEYKIGDNWSKCH